MFVRIWPPPVTLRPGQFCYLLPALSDLELLLRPLLAALLT